MKDRFFLKINKYSLDYLKTILPEYDMECGICGAPMATQNPPVVAT